jgi:hypothetical protein
LLLLLQLQLHLDLDLLFLFPSSQLDLLSGLLSLDGGFAGIVSHRRMFSLDLGLESVDLVGCCVLPSHQRHRKSATSHM